ncbi:hypothetical protein IC614_02720 [Allosphingosinicella flava]|uniref:Uncharacterized protein n=1 Tax=Allosphingosinicella flava TaxID=2771430 RepID=A0A7T2GKH7_9SPHN|nr:hypothetical protein [Sphingosinicella flava]QPQ55535.1 hypothetical protein IC614_02720 [Sphingosinicella flava]
MRETKPFASLSSGLLARKGMAKPAMRPQGFGNFGGMEDLGWNDMGQGRPTLPPVAEPVTERQPNPVAGLTPGPVVENFTPAKLPEAPVVIEQQRDLVEHFGDSAAPAAKEDTPAPRKRQALDPARENVKLPHSRVVPGAKGKAAFTLRLDPERHLRLRLAAAVTRQSAQMLVTGALDTYLDGLTELQGVSVPGQIN